MGGGAVVPGTNKYCKTMGSHIKHDDALYTVLFNFLLRGGAVG